MTDTKQLNASMPKDLLIKAQTKAKEDGFNFKTILILLLKYYVDGKVTFVITTFDGTVEAE